MRPERVPHAEQKDVLKGTRIVFHRLRQVPPTPEERATSMEARQVRRKRGAAPGSCRAHNAAATRAGPAARTPQSHQATRVKAAESRIFEGLLADQLLSGAAAAERVLDL